MNRAFTRSLTTQARAACISTTNEVQLLRTQQPANPENCPVNVIADTVVPYPVEDLAILTINYTPGGRDNAMRRLSSQACYYGGDTVYALTDTPRNSASTLLTARVARRPAP
jgi:hypothetical protein